MGDLALEGVTKRFGEVTAVDGVSLEVRDGELLVLVGPSGCGKTSILRVIAGLDSPDSGEVYLDGTRVTELPTRKRNVGFAFEDFALFPHLNVRENLSFNLRMRGETGKTTERVTRIADLLDIRELLDRHVDELSGGQKQRVALGRAIAAEPMAFLLDEPFANLDANLRSRMQTEIARIQDRLGVTTVHVTHDQQEALSMGDRVAVLKDGAVQQIGSPEDIYARPATLFVARFIGTPSMNVFRGRATATGDVDGLMVDDVGLRVPISRDSLGDVTEPIVGVRPEDVMIEEGRWRSGVLPATIAYTEFRGADRVVHVTAEGGEELVARVDGDRSLSAGDEVGVTVDWDRFHLFDPKSGCRLQSPGGDEIPAGGPQSRADPS